jgi:hypothetical protein
MGWLRVPELPQTIKILRDDKDLLRTTSDRVQDFIDSIVGKSTW